jgi:hypothetical protein
MKEQPRFYIRVRVNGHTLMDGWAVACLPDEYLNALQGAVVNEYIKRQRTKEREAGHWEWDRKDGIETPRWVSD